MTNPKILRISLESDVQHAHGEDKEDGNGPHHYHCSIVVVKSAQLLKNYLKVHSLFN